MYLRNTPEALLAWPELEAAVASFLKECSQLCRVVRRAVDSTAGQMCTVPGLPWAEAEQLISPVPANSQPEPSDTGHSSLSWFCEFCSALISQGWDRHPFPP